MYETIRHTNFHYTRLIVFNQLISGSVEVDMKTILVLSIMTLLSLAVASPRAPCGCKPDFEYCANDHATYHSICEYKCKHPSTPFQDWYILYYGPCVSPSEITTTTPRDEPQRIAVCGENGYERAPQTGDCYKFHWVTKAWDAARATCRDEGADLAIINSATESEALREIYDKYYYKVVGAYDRTYAIIGYKEIRGEGWVTINGDSLAAAGFDGWGPGEPNNARGLEQCGCVFWINGQLNDCECFKPFPFICEIPL
ncbi:hemolymph lipopolysaccharide-binding protein-like [Cydia splendana]|uniref:hemolymph lipopolysaccharide-binding protein-like n=1 Tax=Cydia splendana TaxID=1100963 RepID=UPI0028F4C2EE